MNGISVIQYKGVKHGALSLGAYQIQLQRLAAFTLQDHIGKQSDSLLLDEKKFTTIWVEFELTFDHQFLYEGVKAKRRAKFYSLKQGDLLVVDFERKFTSLSTFIPRVHISKEEETRVFEERLLLRYRDLVVVQMRHFFKEVVVLP